MSNNAAKIFGEFPSDVISAEPIAAAENLLPRHMELGGPSAPLPVEVSIVIPCLNEAETIGICVEKATRALRDHTISGEIIVADNGSTDGSQAIALALGARVTQVKSRGYGNALMGGIDVARGKFVIMGDADDSYDFLEIPNFVKRLRSGFELVQGCRLPSGGGRVEKGAMPLLHRWWGNPMFSFMARWMFRSPVHDVYCGLRGFTKDLYSRLGQRCTGMEFATEMIIKSSLYGARIAEVPITLHPDGRKTRVPHLKTFRDGWRTLRFLLMYSPRWLFLIPGTLLICFGILGYAMALPGVRIQGIHFDVHTLLVSTLSIICGYQSLVFAVSAKCFAVTQGLLPDDHQLNRFFKLITLERGLVLGTGSLLIGLSLLLIAINQWRLVNFGDLEYATTMRWIIPGVLLVVLGLQTVLSSFFLGILRMGHKIE